MLYKVIVGGGFLLFSVSAVQAKKCLEKQKKPFVGDPIISDIPILTHMADQTAHFLKKVPSSKYVSVEVGDVFKKYYSISLEDVQETADFVAKVGKKRPELLKSPWFYNEYFTFYRWYADGQPDHEVNSVPRGWGKYPEFIRTTKYLSRKVHGSRIKTAHYTHPIYMVPADEKGHTHSFMRDHKKDFVRFRYTKKEVLAGALDKTTNTHVITWLCEDDYKEFIMQGTVKVVFEEGDDLILRVAGSNGHEGEQRYWFAAPVIYKDPTTSRYPLKVEPLPGVAFAGNFKELGFGKLLALRGWNVDKQKFEVRMGMLVDTGGRFKDNLYKLDIFTGYFNSRDEYYQKTRDYPHMVQAYILIRKKDKHLKL